ncbi:MAG: AAA family ATPase, partial [Clostridia bacterium]|nr:AAA family ATPase [Clostridia bacterium]
NSYSGDKKNDVLSINDELINSCRTEIERLTKEIDEANYEKYNNSFKQYYDNRINFITNNLNNYSRLDIFPYSVDNYLKNARASINILNDFSVYNLFDKFKYGNHNYVLFGKNGAGKTTLLKKLSNELLNSNSLVAPATRAIEYNVDGYLSQNQFNLNYALNNNDRQSTMYILTQCVRTKETEELREGIPNANTIVSKIKNIFSSLGLDRDLYISTDCKLYLYADNTDEKYLLKDGSDGEKTVLYFIMAILLAPKDYYVFIDEPENHLNGAIMKKLFDALEKARPDIKYIYATHNVSFIETRKNIKLIYLEKTGQKDTWAFREIEKGKELPLDLLLNVEGTNDDVIFCEGASEESYDCKLYSVLFPNYQIIHGDGCERVIAQTELVNANEYAFRKKAYGIIDNDFKSVEDIELLKEKNIRVLKINEIENAYILEPCLLAMIQHNSINISISELKNRIINEIKKNIEKIKRDFATKLYRNMEMENKFGDISNIEAEFDRITNINKTSYIDKYKCFTEQLDAAINNSDYNALMRLAPGKSICTFVGKEVGFANKKVLFSSVLKKASEDHNLVTQLRDLMFDNIDL